MPGYRICSLDAEGLIRDIRSGRFDSHDAAFAAAAELIDHFHTVEVWNGGRLLKSLRRATHAAQPCAAPRGGPVNPHERDLAGLAEENHPAGFHR